MAEMTGVVLTLFGAPDRVFSWSDFSLQHKKLRKLNRICRTISQAFTGIVILTTCWSSVDDGPLWLWSYKQQSLAYCNMCYLLWSHVEYRIVFFIIGLAFHHNPFRSGSKKISTEYYCLINYIINWFSSAAME